MPADEPMGEQKPEDPAVRLAAERTLLAWVRTGLATMGFGFVVARFGLFLRELAAAGNTTPPRSLRFSLWIGSALVVFGIVVNVVSAFEHLRVLHRIELRLPYQPPKIALGPIYAIGLAGVGVAILIYLIWIVG